MLRIESSGVESLEMGEAAAVRGGETIPPEVRRVMLDALKAGAEWVGKQLASLASWFIG